MNKKPVDNQSPATAAHAGPVQEIARGKRSFGSGRLKPWQANAIAIVATVATRGLRFALNDTLGGRPTLVIFMLPVMLSAYLGGLPAGLLATALSSFFACYYLLPPSHDFRVASHADRWQLFFVILTGVVISVSNEALHRARRRGDLVLCGQRTAPDRSGT